jgi:hypothetical protein
MTNRKSSRSEKIVSGFAIAVLAAGFATGVFAQSDYRGPRADLRMIHFVLSQDLQNE